MMDLGTRKIPMERSGGGDGERVRKNETVTIHQKLTGYSGGKTKQMKIMS